MSVERTFSIIKPDAVAAGQASEILAMIQQAGFRVLNLRMTRLTESQAQGFYAVHRERPFFAGLVKFMTEGPVIVMALEAIPNSAAVLIAALALIASGCVKLDAIYRIIDWKIIVLVAGTLPLATALAKTGATAMMANGMVAVLGALGPVGVLATLFLVTALVGLFISNSATAVLMAPVAIDAAGALNASPQAFAMTVAIACSAAYVTPVSSALNMLVMEPGGYTFGDYVKVGVPLLLLTMVITVALVSIIYRS